MKPILILASAMAIAAAPMVAFAKPKPDHNNGNGIGHQQQVYNGEAVHCPPGLANRNPPCVPPGLARQGMTTEEWTGRQHAYQEGDVLLPTDFNYLTDPDYYDLPALTDGSRYAVIDGMIVALDAETYEIIQLIRTIAAIGN